MNVAEVRDSLPGISEIESNSSSENDPLLMVAKRAINERTVLTRNEIRNADEIPYTIDTLCKELGPGWSNEIYMAFYDNLCILAANYLAERPNPNTMADLSDAVYSAKFTIIKATSGRQSSMVSSRDLKWRVDDEGYAFHALRSALSQYPVSKDARTSERLCEEMITRSEWRIEANKLREMLEDATRGNYRGMNSDQWGKTVQTSARLYSQLLCDPNNKSGSELKRFFRI